MLQVTNWRYLTGTTNAKYYKAKVLFKNRERGVNAKKSQFNCFSHLHREWSAAKATSDGTFRGNWNSTISQDLSNNMYKRWKPLERNILLVQQSSAQIPNWCSSIRICQQLFFQQLKDEEKEALETLKWYWWDKL